MSKVELKPCPFCGGGAIYEAETRKSGIAHCADYGCIGHHYAQDEQGGWNHSSEKGEAIAAWNTRYTPEDAHEQG